MDGMDTSIFNDPVVVRKFLPDDLQAALEIDRDVFGGYNPAIFTAFYEYHSVSTLVADLGGTVAGFVLGFKHTPFEGRVFWLAVRPGFQNRGIGTRLMLEVLRSFRQIGAMSATLEVRVSNKKAQSLYSMLGFRMIGICPAYYTDGEAAIIMRMRL
ncbi:MAG: ribosomal protein S18-alanine N-acetyltransferase [Methanothrix sp.]|jgi:ribosomal-protein-alanine N-acetyltransferase|nr:ribosomal protein S18-alanine N-acetyltransferase [Methanothrix sp.]